MANLSMPAIGNPNTLEWRLIPNTASFTSSLTGATQTVRQKGERWGFRAEWFLGATNASLLKGLVAELNGGRNRLLAPDWGYVMRGVGGGSPTVDGAGQTGHTLNINTPGQTSVTNYLRIGDYLAFNNELKMVTSDVNTDGSDNASVPITPAIYTSPADLAAVDIVAPVEGVFLLVDAVFNTRPPNLTHAVLEAIGDIV